MLTNTQLNSFSRRFRRLRARKQWRLIERSALALLRRERHFYVLCKLSEAYVHLGKPQEALALAREGRKAIGKHYGFTMSYIATATQELGRFAEAADIYREILDMADREFWATGDATAHYASGVKNRARFFLAENMRALGRTKEAAMWYRLHLQHRRRGRFATVSMRVATQRASSLRNAMS